jgi:hypothetical protein
MNQEAHKFFFNQRVKAAPRIALPLFILLAALLHLSTIYLFNIVYQAPRVSKPRAAQVFFLLPGSSPSEQLGPWLQGHDPAIFSPLKTIQAHQTSASADLYRSSQPPPLHLLPAEAAIVVQPPRLPVHEAIAPPSPLVSFKAEAGSLASASSKTLQKTTVSFLNELAPRALMLSSSGPLLPESVTSPLLPTTLRANVDEEGVPRHAIVVNSSGNADADEAATHWLMMRRFAPAAHKTWGNLIVVWGNTHDEESKSEK